MTENEEYAMLQNAETKGEMLMTTSALQNNMILSAETHLAATRLAGGDDGRDS